MFLQNKSIYFIQKHVGIEKILDDVTSVSYASQLVHQWVTHELVPKQIVKGQFVLHCGNYSIAGL